MSLKVGLRFVRLNPQKRISLEKIFTWFAKKISKIDTIKEICDLDPTPVLRQLQSQPRKRKSLTENLIEFLS